MARDKLTVFYVENQLQPEFWAWAAADPSAAAVLEQGAEALMGFLVGRLEAAGLEVAEAHGIVHDKDTRQVWDPVAQDLVSGLKPEHLHGIVKFKGGRDGGATLAQIAELLGVPAEMVEKPRRGGRAVDGRSQSQDNKLAYLIHIKDTDKFQYSPDEVATVRGEEYMAIFTRRKEAWLNGRGFVKKARAAESVEGLREKVLNGEITKAQIMLTDHFFEVYSRHAQVIDDALNAYGQRRAYQAAQKLRNGDFSTTVVFVHGPAGVGKTRFATDLIQTALEQASCHGERWELYRAATANPLDDWRGEEVVLLDDLRASAMDANDWLLLLDPYNASPARARYRNKSEVAPRLIVITATIEPVEFFFYARQKGQVDEALDQFIRRLASIVRVFRVDDLARYLVQRTGQVERYVHAIERSDREGRTSTELLELEYGVVDAVEHSAEGATSELLLGLARSNGDIPWSAADGWGDHEDRVARAIEARDRRVVEAAEEAARRAEEEKVAEIERLKRQIAELPEKQARQAEQRERFEAERKAREQQAALDRLRKSGFVMPTGAMP